MRRMPPSSRPLRYTVSSPQLENLAIWRAVGELVQGVVYVTNWY